VKNTHLILGKIIAIMLIFMLIIQGQSILSLTGIYGISQQFTDIKTTYAQQDIKNLTLKVKWRVHSNPTDLIDDAYAVCESGDYIYVFGLSKGNYARFEIRYKSSGSLIRAWESIRLDDLMDCVIDNGRIYVTEILGRILTFDLSLKVPKLLLMYKHKSFYEWTYSITYYKGYIYITGTYYTENSKAKWRVEKLVADDLTFVKMYVSNMTSKMASAFNAKVNPITKQLWVTGVEDEQFRVEILDLDLNPIKIIKKNDKGLASTVDFDEDGYAYIGGDGFIAKYDKYGNEIKLKEITYHVKKLLYVNGSLFVATNEKEGGYRRHVLYVYNKDLNQIERSILSQDINADADFGYGKMAFDGKNLYIAGIDYKPGNSQWTIYSISLLPDSEIVMPAENRQTTIILMWLILGTIIASIVLVIALILIEKRRQRKREELYSKIPPSPF